MLPILFVFNILNLSKIDVSCNGHSIHNRPFEPNFEQGLYLKSYLSLYQAFSAFGLNKSFYIAKEDYNGGYCMWGYDLTADQGSEEGQLHPIKTGSLRIESFSLIKLWQQLSTLLSLLNLIIRLKSTVREKLLQITNLGTDRKAFHKKQTKNTDKKKKKKKTKQSFSGLRRNRQNGPFQKRKQCWDSDLPFH